MGYKGGKSGCKGSGGGKGGGKSSSKSGGGKTVKAKPKPQTRTTSK